MEKVFWLMYLADLMGNLVSAGAVALVVAGVSVVVLTVCAANDCLEDGAFTRAFSVLKWLAIPIAIAAILPSQRTVQLLAVASASDVVVSTQLGQKGVEALNAVLERVIKESKKEPVK